MTSPTPLNKAFQTANEWLHDLGRDKAFEDPERGYIVLRAVLHHLRDRLPVNEATHLGAQLPTFLRGLYYGSWKPSATPVKERNLQAFLDGIRKELKDHPEIDPELAARAVFRLLNEHVSRGEIGDVIDALPDDVRRLWPDSAPPA